MTMTTINIPAQQYDAAAGLDDLDPVTAFLQDLGPGRGQLTLVCWGRAWTCFWGAMGDGMTLAEFLRKASSGYLIGKLMLPRDVMLKRAELREEHRLRQIIEALKANLRPATVARPQPSNGWVDEDAERTAALGAAPVALTERALLDLAPTTIPAAHVGELLWFARAVERAHKITGADHG